MIETNIEEKKKRGRKLTKNSPKMYFTQETENAIIRFNNETDDKIRNEIYETEIKFAFEKLTENIFNTFKFSYFQVSPLDVQQEVVSFLVANINKFKEGKGKAFSYFSIVAKNYLILLNNSTYKKFKQDVDIDDHTDNLVTTHERYSPRGQTKEFINLMVNYWEKAIPVMFKKKKESDIAYAVLELFRQIDRLENFNKKALYIYVREMTDCKTQNITKVINKMKNTQTQIYQQYLNYGSIDNIVIEECDTET